MSDMKHISNEVFPAFQDDLLNQKDREAFLEHICSCNYCSNQLAIIMNKNLLKAPRDMKANILKATRLPEVQIAAKVKETSKRIQLLLYSLKVGTATVFALILLVLSMNLTNFAVTPDDEQPTDTVTETNNGNENVVPLTAVIRDNMDALSNSILDFTNSLMKTEVKNND